MAFGRRCAIGCESWPDSDEYKVCPSCLEPTKRYRNLTPLTEDEGKFKKLHIEFEEYYERRCLDRGISANGPIADEFVASGPIPERLLVPTVKTPQNED